MLKIVVVHPVGAVMQRSSVMIVLVELTLDRPLNEADGVIQVLWRFP
jgi:hypothetical protein